MVIRWLRSETMAMIGLPALRDSMDSIGLQPLLAPALSPAAISTARLATATHASRSRVCLRFGFTQRDVMRLLTDRVYASLYSSRYRTSFGRTCQLGTTQMLLDPRRAPARRALARKKRPSAREERRVINGTQGLLGGHFRT